MDEDSNGGQKPSEDLVAVDGHLAIVVSPVCILFTSRRLKVSTQAGADTVAISLSHIWYFLLNKPNCLQRLRKELDDTFPLGEDSSLNFAKQSTMPYLNACM